MSSSSGDGRSKKEQARKAKRGGEGKADGFTLGPVDLEYGNYKHFLELIAKRDGIKPKVRPLSWLMRHIEEIYDLRYAKDTADLRGEAEAGGAEAASCPFPQFVVDFFSKRYGLPALIDQHCWDLLYNLHRMRKESPEEAGSPLSRREHVEIETFARFLETHYDPDDLLFYLYVRSVVQKELNVSFRARWSELGKVGADGGAPPNTGAFAPLFLNVRECAVVSRVVFGSEADPLYRTFMAMLERHLTGSRSGRTDLRRIEVTQFLHLALVEYHETRPADDGDARGLAAPSSGRDADALSGLSHDDLSAAGLRGGGSATDVGRRVREADASYESRQGGGASAPAAVANLKLLRASPRFFEQLGDSMHRANEAYLDRALESARELPPEVQAQIRAEVKQQLEAKLDALLSSVIKSATASPPVREPLSLLFGRVMAAASGDEAVAAAYPDANIDSFCDAVLKHPDVKELVAPLVGLLVTYATSRLQDVVGT